MSKKPFRYWHNGDQTTDLRKDMRKVGDTLEQYCEPDDTEGGETYIFRLRSDSVEIDPKTREILVPMYEIIDAMYDAEGRPSTAAGRRYAERSKQ